MDSTELLAHVCRFALALALGAAGVAKVANRADFRQAVANYRMLPGWLVRPVAMALPFVEILAAVLLLVGAAPHVVGTGAAALLLSFTVAVALNLARGRTLDCGCFGAATPRQLTWWTVGRNLVLVGVAAGVAVGRPDGLAVWAGTQPGSPPPPQEVLASAALAFLVVAGAFVASEAVAVRRRLRTLDGLRTPEGTAP